MSEKIGFWRWLWDSIKLIPKNTIQTWRSIKESAVFETIGGMLLAIFSLAYTLTISLIFIFGILFGVLMILHAHYREEVKK